MEQAKFKIAISNIVAEVEARIKQRRIQER